MFGLGGQQWKLIGGILVLAALVGSHTYTYFKGKQTERSDWLTKQAEAQAEAFRQKDAYDQLARGLVKQVQEKERLANEYYRKWRAEVGKVTTGNVCLNGASVGLWNTGLLGEGSLPGTAAGATPAPAATDTAVLENHLDNAEQYAACRRQLNALIDFYENTRK
jgi:hypothetical protein